MPVTNFVDPSNHFVLTVGSGNVTRSELVSSLTRLKQNADLRAGFHQLIDLSHASHSKLDFKSLFDIHRAHDPFSGNGKRAIIAPNSAAFGMARMYQSIVNGLHIEVFHTTMEAIRWLGLEITILGRSQIEEKPAPPKRARGQRQHRLESRSNK